MGYTAGVVSTSRPPMPFGILETVEKYSVSFKADQTPCSYACVEKMTMAKNGDKSVSKVSMIDAILF